jgi:hypothetical protein
MKRETSSSVPLLRKLGIKTGYRMMLLHEPPDYLTLLGELPVRTFVFGDPNLKYHFIHCFVTSMHQLEAELIYLKSLIVEEGIIWISWYKKASKIDTDVTEDKIRELALNLGLVDVKVCSIDEKWSALKLVIPLKYRKKLN